MPRLIKGLLWGALTGAILVAPDGVVMGALTGDFWSWVLVAAAVGAVVGMLVGGLAVKLGPRMVLNPPEGEEDNRYTRAVTQSHHSRPGPPR